MYKKLAAFLLSFLLFCKEIKAGRGPDIYLLPGGDLPAPEDYLEKAQLYRAMNDPYPIDAARMPALFQDVEISKRKGAFADITGFTTRTRR